MSFLDFVLSVARTWGHIIVGLSVLFTVFIACCAIGAWYNRIVEQLDEMRNQGKLPKQPWKYQ